MKWKCTDFPSLSQIFLFFLDLEIEIDEDRDVGEYSKHSDDDDDLEPHSLQRSIIKGLDEDDLYPF